MKTDWKDDVFEQRKYKMTNNSDGTVSLEDATEYSQTGDAFGAKELNEIGEEVNALTNEVAEAKKSVSDGKNLIAAAITLKKVATAATDTFATMAANIAKITLGSGNAVASDVLKGKTFTNDDGVEYTGTLEDKSGTTQMGTVSLDTANSRVQIAIPAMAKYDTKSKVYTAFLTLANLIGLNASVLKKGVNILGITGTWEGFVAGDGVIYNQGTIGLGGGFVAIPNLDESYSGDGAAYYLYESGTLHYDTGMIRIDGYTMSARTREPVDLSAYKQLNIRFISNKGGSGFKVACSYAKPESIASAKDVFSTTTITKNKETTITLDISSVQAECYIAFGGMSASNGDGELLAYEVWLS